MDELTELISDRTELKESAQRLQQALTALALPSSKPRSWSPSTAACWCASRI
jgi:hypothetical protein